MAAQRDPDKDLKTKYRTIFSREHALARAVSHAVIKARPISVWEVLIPILLVFSFAKSRETREIFVQNFLFTKQLALKGARDMKREGISRRETLSRLDQETRNLLESIKERIYSEEVRRNQMDEMDLLLQHYSRLFDAEGEDYETWLAHAYGNLKNYLDFIGALKSAEKEVYLAAMETVGSQRNTEMVINMEKATERVRVAEAEKIFNSLPSHRHVNP